MTVTDEQIAAWELLCEVVLDSSVMTEEYRDAMQPETVLDILAELHRLRGERDEAREAHRLAKQHLDAVVTSAETERDALRAEVEALRSLADRVKTAADELFGPFPVQSADDAMSQIEWNCFKNRVEIERMRECLEWLDRGGGLGHDVHRRIRAALAAPDKEGA